MTEYTAPHVHTALLAIYNDLKVEKDGTLPSNMSGKAYITAGNLSASIKEQFIKHELIFHPVSERIWHHEVAQDKTQRTLIALSVEGTYRIISTKDGSFIEIGGAGDGLATATSVANNIASTNALKNALLRLVMATEGGVESQSKDGIGESEASAPAAQSGIIALRRTLQEKAKEQAPAGTSGVEWLDLVMASSEGDLKNRTVSKENRVWEDEAALEALNKLVDEVIKQSGVA
jgi:hypothetical protein